MTMQRGGWTVDVDFQRKGGSVRAYLLCLAASRGRGHWQATGERSSCRILLWCGAHGMVWVSWKIAI